MSEIRSLDALESELGYEFSDKTLLSVAMTHKSFFHEHPEEATNFNERLEFLGDSVLALVVVEYLYLTEGALPESAMSRIKSHVVKGKVLYEVALEIALGDFVRIGKGEEETGGRLKESILANALEALIGAVYLDGGFERARVFILNMLKIKIDDALNAGRVFDYKSDLQELSQSMFGVLPEYILVSEEGLEHIKTFTFEVLIEGNSYGKGRGSSKKIAQTAAAHEAIIAIKARKAGTLQ